MFGSIANNTATFLPHGFCFAWQPEVLWLNAISDALIALAYFSIPITLVYFVRKRNDVQFNWMFISFALFIVACGATHLIEIWNIWYPNYWLAGWVKAVTALASISTAFLLIKLVPTALSIPSPAGLKHINEQLKNEIAERTQTEKVLYERNNQLEKSSLELKFSEERFRNSFETAAIGMALVAPDGRWLKVNHSLCKMLGMTEQYLLSKTFQDITHPDDLDLDLKYLNELLQDNKNNYQMQKRYYHLDGHVIWINLSVSIVRDINRNPVHLVAQIEDITERKLNEDKIKALAFYDSLTGLPNRRVVIESLGKEMLRAKRNKHPMAVFFIDVDYFKSINDNYGHDVGDEVLKLISHNLNSYIRNTDTLGRLGGDEFLVILSDIKTEINALSVANNMLNGVGKPFLIKGYNIKIGLSIGIAMYQPDSIDSADELLRKADMALYDVKASGRNSLKVYQEI